MYYAKRLVSMAAASLVIASPAVFAHGDAAHSKPKAVNYSKAEETPFGRAGDPKKANRTIRVGMADTMRFVVANTAQLRTAQAGSPSTSGDVVVKRGETVRFVVHNQGKVMHEMVIGRMEELKQHAELMRKFPNMEHDELYMTHVAPSKQGEIVWQFTKAGEFYYACLIPGHFQAGMVAKITVK